MGERAEDSRLKVKPRRAKRAFCSPYKSLDITYIDERFKD